MRTDRRWASRGTTQPATRSPLRIEPLEPRLLLSVGPVALEDAVFPASPQGYHVGDSPLAVVVGDFNGDGLDDLAATDSADSTVSVLLGYGGGTFADSVPFPTGDTPVALALGDFDADGRLDLATADTGDGSVSVLLGYGDGSFADSLPSGVGGGPSSVAVGDFNGDGLDDLAATNAGDATVSVLLGLGDGTFDEDVPYATGTAPQCVAVADFDADGHPDLVVANQGSDTVGVLLGLGDGTFADQVTHLVGDEPQSVAAGDFTRDGLMDLVVANPGSNTVSLLYGQGDGSFVLKASYAAAGAPWATAVADFDGDGRTDFVFANSDGDSVRTAHVGAWPPPTYPVGDAPKGITAGDFDGDGRTDLVTANSAGNTLSVLLNQGGTVPCRWLAPSGAACVTIYDTDGIADVNPEDIDVRFGKNGAVTSITLRGSQPMAGLGIVIRAASVGKITDKRGDNAGELAFIASNAPVGSIALKSGIVGYDLNGQSLGGLNFAADVDGDGETDDYTSVYCGATLGSLRLLGTGSGAVVAEGVDARGWSIGTLQVNVAMDLWVHAAGGLRTAKTYRWQGGGIEATSLASITVSRTRTMPFSGTLADAELIVGEQGVAPPANPRIRALGKLSVAGWVRNTRVYSYGHVGTVTAGGIDSSELLLGADALPTTGDDFWAECVFASLTVKGMRENGAAVDSFLDTDVASWHIVKASIRDVQTANGAQPFGFAAIEPGAITWGQGGNTYRWRNGGWTSPPPPMGDFVVRDLDEPILAPGGSLAGPGGGTAAPPAMTPPSFETAQSQALLASGPWTPSDAIFPDAPPTYAAGDWPECVAVGDFNGDGRQDLAVNNDSDDTVSVLLGYGDGTFTQQATTTVGDEPEDVAVGDFNGDGRDDLAVANSDDNNVSILLGRGNGTFADPITYGVDNSPYSLIVGDFDGDACPDLAVANLTTSNVSILLGDGDGTFADHVTYTVADGPRYVEAGDFNGDGRDDLAVANSGSATMSILLGHGDGTFADHVTYDVGTSPEGVAVGDFDGDGRQDLAVTNIDSNNVSVLLGHGDGTFADQTTYAVGTGPQGIVVGDFDGDGRDDLAASNRDSNDVSILAGHGDGTFAEQVTYTVGSYPWALALGDFNADGHDDLAVGNAKSDNVSVLLGLGDGSFPHEARYPAGDAPRHVAIADLNGDGIEDIVVADHDSASVIVRLGRGGGTLAPGIPCGTGNTPRAVAIGDLNADGHQDLAVANSGDDTIGVLLGHGDGTFAAQVACDVGASPVALALDDTDGNDTLDIVATNGGGSTVSVLLGNGDGTFDSQVAYDVGNAPQSVAIGDLDDDGCADLAVANHTSNDVSILIGNGDGTFADQEVVSVGSLPTAIAFGDLDRDGNRDLVTANNGSDDVSVLLGNGDGTFADQQTYGVGSQPLSVAVGDLDGDGHDDLAVANAGDDTVSVLIGQGDGTFADAVDVPVGPGPNSVAMGDLNGDGRADLAVANLDGDTLSVLLNQASAPLVQWRHPYGNARVSIYDMDGIPDVDPADIRVRFGKNNTVTSITLGGSQAMAGLGIVISGSTSVGSIKDARRGLAGDLAFIASDAPIRSIALKAGTTGYNLDGRTLGGLAFAADIDGDGLQDDRTALYCAGTVGSARLLGTGSGEFVVDGTDDRGGSIGTLDVCLASDLTVVAAGGIRTVKTCRWHTGGVHATSLASLTTKARKGVPLSGDFGGVLTLVGDEGDTNLGKARIAGSASCVDWWSIRGELGSLTVGGDFLANMETQRIRSMVVKGDLAGAWITVVEAVDPADARVRAIGSLKVAGWIVNSRIWSLGHVGSVAAAGMAFSELFLGLVDFNAGLPGAESDFRPDLCVLTSLTIAGIKGDGGAYVDSFVDSAVAARQIARASVREVATDNGGEPFGFAAVGIGSLTWRQGNEKWQWRDGAWLAPPPLLEDFVVQEVV